MSLNVRRCRNIGLFLFTVSYNHTLCGYRVSSINILISYSEVYKVHHTTIYPAVQWSTKLQRELIFKHDGDSYCESARDLVSRRDRRGWLYRCFLLKRIFILEIRRRKYLSARNLFSAQTRFVSLSPISNSLYSAYSRNWSQTPGQLSCTIAVYMHNWKCYIVHSDGEHEMLRYNWSPWLVTGITTSRYGRPTTNLLYLAVSRTTPLTRHCNATSHCNISNQALMYVMNL